MPTQTFSSFEDFYDANRHSSLRHMLLGPKRGNWVLTYLIANNLSLQWGQEGAKSLVEGATRLGGITIFLPTQNPSALTGNGRRFDEFSLMTVRPGDEFCLSATDWRHWASLYIPNEVVASANRDATAAIGLMTGVVQLPPNRIGRFRSVVEQLGVVVQRAAAAFESVAALKVVERKLVQEIRNVLVMKHEVEHTHGPHVVPRRQIICMAMDFFDQHDGEYLSVEQLATAAGVSERTLRDAFQQQFGIAPVQYLKLRTLHQVRRALKSADPSVKTVTEIATQFGVWQFGRCAHDYRLLFGEFPSETLRHQC